MSDRITLIKRIITWFITISMIMMALIMGALHNWLGLIIFLIIAFLCSPYRRYLLNIIPERFRKAPIIVGTSFLLAFASILATPTDNVNSETNVETETVASLEETLETETVVEVAKTLPSVEESIEESSEETTETKEEAKETEASVEARQDTKKIEKKNEAKEETTDTAQVKETNPNDANNTVVPAQDTTVTPVQDTPAAVVQDTASASNVNSSAADNSTVISNGTGNGGEIPTGTAPAGAAYIVNKTSKDHKVHLPTCSTLPENDNQIIFNSKEECWNAGYTNACQRCKPW